MSGRTLGAMVLALLFPGAGHFVLGRRRRAVAFAAIVISMFVIGLLIDGKIYSFASGRHLNNLATLGSMGAGLLYVITRVAGVSGDVLSATYEHGTAFVLTAGVMNILLVLDAFDIAEDRKP